jgi:hypothetical protein
MDKARDMEMRIDIDIDVNMDMDMDTKNGLLVFLGQVIFFQKFRLLDIGKHFDPPCSVQYPLQSHSRCSDIKLSPISCHGCD